MQLYVLIYFEIQIYYRNNAQLSSKNEFKLNGVNSRNNFPQIKDGAYIRDLDQ